jgi:hypothetical protein
MSSESGEEMDEDCSSNVNSYAEDDEIQSSLMEVEEHSLHSDHIDVKSIPDNESVKLSSQFDYDIPPTVKWLLYPDDDHSDEDP